MIILTQMSGGTYTAQVRSDQARGFRVLYRASSTESHASAARAVVSKFFGRAAAETVQQIPDKDLAKHIPSTTTRKRCNPPTAWTFQPKAK